MVGEFFLGYVYVEVQHIKDGCLTNEIYGGIEMSKLEFVIMACVAHRATTFREKSFWENQYDLFKSGVRNAEMHDFTLVTLSEVYYG